MIIEQPVPAAGRPPATSLTPRTEVTVVAVLALAIAAGIVVATTLLQGRGSPLGAAARYVPADAVIYLEADLSLPAGQRENLRAILERFPALDPSDVLSEALADTLDDALAGASTPFDYSNDVAPWFDGSLAFALLDYPLNADPTQFRMPGAAGFLGVRDSAAAARFADDLRRELEAQGNTFSSADHHGVTIWSLDLDPSSFFPMSDVSFAYALTDGQLVLASGREPVEAVLDAARGARERLVDVSEVADLLATLPAERVGAAIVNGAAMLADLRAELEATQPELAEALQAYLAALPPYSVASVRFDQDAVLLDSAAGLGEGAFRPVNGPRPLAERVPDDAILFADASSLGAGLEQAMAAMRSMLAVGPMGEEQMVSLEQVEAALGAGLTELVSWIGSGAVVAGWEGEEPYFGLLLEAEDPDAARRRLDQLRALAELASQEGGGDVQVTTEDVGGVEVTTLRFGDTGSMLLGTFDVVVEYALDGDVAILGVGDRYVRDALALDAGSSLAASDRFAAVVDRFGGADNAGVMFLDLAGLREAVETATDVDGEPGYAEARPNLLPFDYLGGVICADGGWAVSRMGLVLR